MAWDTNVSGRMGAYLPIQQASADNVRSYSKAGANIGKLIGGMVESSQAESSKAFTAKKINALIQKYNDPNDKDFAGMEGAQRALKLSRLLLPYDAEMSKRWEDRSVLMGREMEAGRTDLQKQQITADTELKKQELKVKSDLNKLDPETPDGVESLMTQYRNSRMLMASPNWPNLDQKEKDQAISEMNGIRTILSKSQIGRNALGIIDAVQQSTEKVEFPLNESKKNLESIAIDKTPKDGIIDNQESFDSLLAEIVGKSGLGITDPSIVALKEYAKSLKDRISRTYQESETKRLEGKSDLQRIKEKASSVKPIFGVYDRLSKNPNDITTRNDALNRLLRDESGAAIGKDEVLNRLSGILSPEDYQSMVSELGGLKGWLASATGNENLLNIQALSRYTSKMNPEKMLLILRDRIGNQDVFDYLKSQSSEKKETPKADRKIVKNATSFFGK